MGLLVDGVWHDQWYDTKSSGGRFIRTQAQFRNWITHDGAAGPSGEGGFRAESGRYHLYVSHACPWAHRALIFRSLKGLADKISLSVVNHFMGDQGWSFAPGAGMIPDPISNAHFMHQIYTRAISDYSGRVTVPVLWDKQTNSIVSNESSEIIRMFNSAFDAIGASMGDYYPAPLRQEIDSVNERVFNTLNNGVYKCGFATSQEAYDESIAPLFDTLDWLEERLSASRYVTGNRLTEADIRLFTTLIRFDAVYVGHFKCNLRQLQSYPNLWGFTRELYQMPAIKQTVHFDHIKMHYYGSHETINPSRIVPKGPVIDYDAPHDRERLAAA